MTVSVAESLRKAIATGRAAGAEFTKITISDATARDLAGELADMQLTPDVSKADIYVQMKAGSAKFLDLPVVVTGQTTP